MHRFLVLSCAVALSAIGCGSENPSATEATEPEVAQTTGNEMAAPVALAPAPAPAPAPAMTEPASPAAAPPAPAPQPPTAAAVIAFKVKDVAAWKTAFDGHEQMRRDTGIMGHAVMMDVSKPNMVAVWLPTNDLTKLEAFTASAELKKAMKDAGVIGKPTFTFMKLGEMSPPSADGSMPKFGAMVDHKVKDYAAWKVAFDADAQHRKDAGVTGYAVSQDPKDPNHVIVWLESQDKDSLSSMLASKELAATMKAAGVKGKPKTTVVENGEFKMYK